MLKVRYTYDNHNRLSREDNAYSNETTVYCYDGSNIWYKQIYTLSFTDTLGTSTDADFYAANSTEFPNAVTDYDGETITYDANGNPTTYRGYSMVWTKSRQLAAMSDTQTTLSFKYDHNGIRSKKTVNGVETKYTYVGSTLVSQKTGSEVINFAYTNGGSPYGFTYNGASYFYLLNLQGDVIGIYDSTGTVVVKYAYDAWGKLISTTGSLASTIGVKNPIRYRGYYYDIETGLYYLQSRYYDPETCRFINADSLLIAGDYLQGTNMYAYCLNNPVMYVDPSGYEAYYHPVLKDLFSVILGSGVIGSVLSENQATIFVKSLVDAGASADDVLRIALDLADIVSGSFVGEVVEGGIFDYKYFYYPFQYIYKLSIDGAEAYVYRNDFNGEKIDLFIENANALETTTIAQAIALAAGGVMAGTAAFLSGMGVVAVGAIGTTGLLGTGAGALGTSILSLIYTAIEKSDMDVLFYQIVAGKNS